MCSLESPVCLPGAATTSSRSLWRPAEVEGCSRITIVVDLDSAPLEQITKQLFKLIDVIKISELDPALSVERELLIATVKAETERCVWS